MWSDRHSKPLRLFLCCVGMGAVTWLAAARTDAFTDPASAMAMAEAASQAAKKAQEVGKTAREILEFLEGDESDPAASLESISQQLTALQDDVNDMRGQLSEALKLLKGIDDELVQQDNITRLLQIEEATSHIYKASGALQRLEIDPKNLNLDLEADSESFTALLKLQGNAVNVFAITGPDVSDERFHHLFSYSTYLAAVAVRVAYYEFKYGGREMTKGKLRDDLNQHAATLRWLAAQVSGTQVYEVEEPYYTTGDHADRDKIIFPPRQAGGPNLVAYTRVRFDHIAGECWGVEVWLEDHVLYDRVLAPANRESSTLDFLDTPIAGCYISPFGGVAPWPNDVQWVLADFVTDVVNARTALYGVPEIVAVADMLDNYVLYGRSTPPPPPAFSGWDYMMPLSSLNSLGLLYRRVRMTFVPEGEPAPGVKVNVLPVLDPRAWDDTTWLIPNANDVTAIMHRPSGLCLTPSPTSDDVTLEVCDGRQDQLWARGGEIQWCDLKHPNGCTVIAATHPLALRNPMTGRCLSSTNAWFSNSRFMPPGWIYDDPGLRLHVCNTERMDQVWTKLDMSWTFGAPVNSSNRMGLAPDGAAAPGASVSLVPAASANPWRFSGIYGLFVHEQSQLCLTQQTGTEYVILETCTGAINQVWTKNIHRFIHNQASGACLSSEKTVVYDLGPLGKQYITTKVLHLEACVSGRTDQIWDGFNEGVQGGVH